MTLSIDYRVWLHSHMIPKLPGYLGYFDLDRAGRTGSMAARSHHPDWHHHRLSDHVAFPSQRYQSFLVADLFFDDGVTGDDES